MSQFQLNPDSKKIETRHFMNVEKEISIGLEEKLWPVVQLIANASAANKKWLSGKGSNFDHLNIWIFERLSECPNDIESNTWIAEAALNYQIVEHSSNSLNDKVINISDSELDKLFAELGGSTISKVKVEFVGQTVIPKDLEGLGIENLLNELEVALSLQKNKP